MAHKKTHNRGQAVEGQVHGSSGATYYITTDKNGVISCSCPSWLFKQKQPIEDRVCKHLQAVFSSQGKALVQPGVSKSYGRTGPVKATKPEQELVRKISFEEDEV